MSKDKRGKGTFQPAPSDNYDEEYEVPKKWYEQFAQDPQDIKPVTEQELIDLKSEAKICHDSEVANYNIKNSRTNSDFKWMKTVMSKGTVSDKIAAHTVAIQDNPICNLETIRTLAGIVKVGKKKECILVMDTLTELFLSDLLIPNKKLRAFHQRPLAQLTNLSSGNAVTRRKLLSAWYFEDQLKEIYTLFVIALNTVAHDIVDNNKEKAISSMSKLLTGNPEQEKNLLAYIVNKLGDPSQKVASKAIYNLSQLLYRHSNMQQVVLNEVEKLLFRSNVSTRAQYYGLCFLSQFYLSHEENEVARRLIEVYFSFFKSCVKKGEVNSRMMSALLMGVNRAYPYAKLEIEKISHHIDTIYRVVHIASFNIGLHALNLLYQVSDYADKVSDRFYLALYKKLIDPKLYTTTHQAMLLSLIYKALLRDTEIPRVKVFVKRLLQLTLYMQPSFACGVLYLVVQLLGKRKEIQCLTLKQTAPTQSSFNDDDDDGDEKYQDVKMADGDEDNKGEDLKVDNEDEEDVKPDVDELNSSIAGPSWHHCKNLALESEKKDKKEKLLYDPMSRNPLYAGGDFCAYTELILLQNHFHPTVALYAQNLLEGTISKYSGDPLKDFTLIRFLDRFVFKNPKKIEDNSGAHPTFGKRKNYTAKGVKSLSVYSSNYLNESSGNIPVDELFMFTYLQRKYREKQVVKSKGDEDSDLESVQSEEFEEMLDKMAGLSKDDDEELDFLNDVGESLKNKTGKNKKRKSEDDEEDEDDASDVEEEDDLSLDGEDDLEDEGGEEFSDDDLDMNDDDKEMLGDLDDDDDEDEDIEFGVEESDEDLPDDNAKSKKSKNARNQSGKNKNKKGKGIDDVSSLFASAEEFASLLEDEGSSKIAPGSSNAYANKDKADTKQLAWEDKRNRWLKGFNQVLGKGKQRGNRKDQNWGKKRGGPNQFGNKAKKMKK